MSAPVIRIDADKVRNALGRFAAAMQPARRQKLMQSLGDAQLVSIYRTFAEEGSPAGSWPPLSAATLSWRKRKPGGKLLIGRGILRNSIRVVADTVRAVIGTGIRYAEVHQFGWSGAQKVGSYSYTRRVKQRDRLAAVAIVNRNGRQQRVRKKAMSGVAFVTVRPFTRIIRIPARPYLVFRPEDPSRLQQMVDTWAAQQASDAGLAVS